MNIPTTYSELDYVNGTKREAKKLIDKHIKQMISENDIQPKSPEWYLLYALKTAINEDHS